MTVEAKFCGQPLKRREDPRLITGAATYVDDLRLPGMLHAAVLRSMHAHARIRSIRLDDARRAPGVAGVFTLADIKSRVGTIPAGKPAVEGAKAPTRYPLAGDEVAFAGEPVAVVVAESAAAARDALDAIDVDYDPLPAVVDPEQALVSSSPRAHSSLPDNVAFRWGVKGGDTDAAFAKADRVVRQRFVSQRLIPCAMETRGVLAQFAPGDDLLTLWTSTQIPHVVRAQLALVLGLPENAIRVVAPEVGGGFGSKLNFYAEEALLAVLAILLSPRPIKWIETRRENMAGTIHGRGQVGEVAVAARSDGKILAIRHDAIADIGAYYQLFTPLIPTMTGLMLCGAYHIPGAHMSLTGVFTNKMSTDAYRGAGRPEATYVIERMMDLVAAELELDPVEVRRANFPLDFPYTTATGVVYDTGDYPKALDKLVEVAGYRKLREEQESRRRQGDLVGIGVSTYVEICAMGPSSIMSGSGWESATVSVGQTGKVDVYTGTCPHGQGQETSFAQIVADRLGVSPEDVRVHRGDTARIPHGVGTFGSRATAVGGAAVHHAAVRIERKLRRIAAGLLKVAEDYVEREGSRFTAGEKSVTVAEVCFQAHRASALPEGVTPGLEETYFFEPRNFTFPFGAHLALVSLDRDTGEVRIEKYFAVDDCGKVINPLLVDGQVHGGIAQGIGQALFEAAVHDDAGQLLTGTLMDYTVPKAAQLPRFQCARTETPTDVNPLGVKGVGEAGTIGSIPAVVNAVMDALRGFGVRHIDMPLTPEKIWRSMQREREPGNDPIAV
jgi:carbon-monoxide dehydrogenase large subunit